MSDLEKPLEATSAHVPALVPAAALPVGAGAAMAPGAGTSLSTHFLFEHKVFAISGAYFSLTQDTKQAVYNVMLGDLQAAIPFATLRNAFDIPDDSHDRRLLEVVEKGLRYVKVIRPGESIPPELLDGTASWSVEDKHRQIAKGRLTVQMVSWITGSEAIIVDITQLEQLVEDPGTKQRLQAAFTEIAKRLGYGEERRQEVTDRVDDLSHELAYVEALRDRYGCIRSIGEKLIQFTKVYRSDRTISQELARIQGLFKKPIKEFNFILDECDAQTGEIVSALKKFDAQIAYIRQVRDELHWKLMDWDEVIAEWQDLPLKKTPKADAVIKGLYRFLASKYLESKVWERR